MTSEFEELAVIPLSFNFTLKKADKSTFEVLVTSLTVLSKQSINLSPVARCSFSAAETNFTNSGSFGLVARLVRTSLVETSIMTFIPPFRSKPKLTSLALHSL